MHRSTNGSPTKHPIEPRQRASCRSQGSEADGKHASPQYLRHDGGRGIYSSCTRGTGFCGWRLRLRRIIRGGHTAIHMDRISLWRQHRRGFFQWHAHREPDERKLQQRSYRLCRWHPGRLQLPACTVDESPGAGRRRGLRLDLTRGKRNRHHSRSEGLSRVLWIRRGR